MNDRQDLATLEAAVADFAAARDWQHFHDPKNLAMAIASESGELCALLRWTRNDESDSALRDEAFRSSLFEELGDVAVLLLLLCQRTGARFDDIVLAKLAENELKYPVIAAKGHAERPAVAKKKNP